MGWVTGSVATISGGAAAAPKISSAPFPLTLTSNQKTGLAINFNLGNALTVSTSQPQVVTAVNLAAPNVLGPKVLPPATTTVADGQLAFVETVPRRRAAIPPPPTSTPHLPPPPTPL